MFSMFTMNNHWIREEMDNNGSLQYNLPYSTVIPKIECLYLKAVHLARAWFISLLHLVIHFKNMLAPAVSF